VLVIGLEGHAALSFSGPPLYLTASRAATLRTDLCTNVGLKCIQN
jgi:hypothetical protein